MLLFQFDYCHAAFALAETPQSEALYGLVALEHLLYGSAQSAGALTVDDSHGFELAHYGAVDILLGCINSLDALHTSEVYLRTDGRSRS